MTAKAGYAGTPDERFARKCAEPDENGCILWVGSMSKGYGRFYFEGKLKQAHRWKYEQVYGKVPAHFDLDHKVCDNRACVNPEHMQPATRRVNLLRGDTIPARHAAKTHCEHGHEFTAENTYVTKPGARACRKCRVRWSKEQRERQVA